MYKCACVCCGVGVSESSFIPPSCHTSASTCISLLYLVHMVFYMDESESEVQS